MLLWLLYFTCYHILVCCSTLLASVMKRLPAPFPFFNQSKRSKQSSSSNYHTNLQPMAEQTNKPTHKPVGISRQYHTSNSPSVQYYEHDHSNNRQLSNTSYPQCYQQQLLPQPYMDNITKPHTHLFHTSQQSGWRQPLRQVTNESLSRTSMAKQSTSHQEPRQVQPAQILSRSRNQTRVITTSSQGVQYWSQYKYYCHLLFEIYGLLDSQVSLGEFGCLQFMLKTVDGVIKCQFWEIDNQLNRLYRGKSYRVIGTWDNYNKVLKCAKVRESTSQEQTQSNQLVKISDTAMREFTSSIPEP